MRRSALPTALAQLGTASSWPGTLGAALVGMEYIQLLPLGTPGDGALHNWVEAGADEMIFVNKYGKRFVREDARCDDLTNALFEQPDSLMYVIVDSKCHTLTQGYNNWGQTADELVEQGYAFQADTLEELAAQIGVPADALVETVNNYNSYYDAGVDKEFGKELMKARIDTPPFYASPGCPPCTTPWAESRSTPKHKLLASTVRSSPASTQRAR